ncbi:hypothetical protein [Amycolatopsis sp. NPDC004079]|uniref:hypothetical protein n=1 Tax=Amycolatopsis sp. NPDC004079 TaxID=3154549 RepID=UPI0033AB8552
MRLGNRISQTARRRLRTLDKLRTKVADASYTEVGQYALLMFCAAALVLAVNLVALGALLFL